MRITYPRPHYFLTQNSNDVDFQHHDASRQEWHNAVLELGASLAMRIFIALVP